MPLRAEDASATVDLLGNGAGSGTFSVPEIRKIQEFPSPISDVSVLDRVEAHERLWLGPMLVVGLMAWLGWRLRLWSQHPG